MPDTDAVETGTTTCQRDPTHASVEFAVKHVMTTTVRGRFKELKATRRGDRERPEEAGLDVTLDAASIDTGVADRDALLRGADFLDADTPPAITCTPRWFGGEPPKAEGDRFQVVGKLVIRDGPTEVVLDGEYLGRGTDPWGRRGRASASGRSSIAATGGSSGGAVRPSGRLRARSRRAAVHGRGR